VTSTSYDDALDRPTHVIVAANTSQKTRIRFEYDDDARTITTVRDLNAFGDGALRSQAVYDGLGRRTMVRQFEDGSEILTETHYDGLGRVHEVTNPYRSGDAAQVTVTEYDALDRVTKMTAPDGAVTQTLYEGNGTLATDAAGKQRQTIVDSLGRVATVTEDPSVAGLETSYEHDAMGNLTKVIQGQQVRTFQYDRLSRLQSATNGESGTTTYDYDDNDNLVGRTDARGVVMTDSYDALDRIQEQVYSDGTPGVSYSYDTAPGGTGRLATIVSAVSTSTFLAYDPFGNVTKYSQRTGDTTFSMSYAYNRAGLVTSAGYPSGRRVDTTYDAAGRVTGVTGTFRGNQTEFIHPGSVTYWPHGAIRAMDLGNGLSDRTSFNNRLQADRVIVGPEQESLLRLDYGYGGANNNGNVLTQTISAGALSLQQSYGYDRLNRLSQASESGSWTQVFGYERFGNRWVEPGSYMPNAAQTPQSSGQFDHSTNRVNIPGTLYDSAGNLTRDWVGRTFDYDAENRQVRFVDMGGVVTYAYDGDGSGSPRRETGLLPPSSTTPSRTWLRRWLQSCPVSTCTRETGCWPR
jgi:YD repeat-containing protein